MSHLLYFMIVFCSLLDNCLLRLHAANDGELISEPDSLTGYRVEEAIEWSELFNRTSGWFGADGIFSFALNGMEETGGSDSVLFIFSDTMIGSIENGKMQPGWSMVNNSVAYL